MPPGSEQISEHLSWDGIVGGSAAAWLGVAFAVLAFSLLWLERYTLGWKRVALCWLLRMAAISCALWMLAGPTRVTTDRSHSAEKVLIFADYSASMNVVDPSDALESLRWNLSTGTPSDSNPVLACDRLATVLALAQDAIRRLETRIREHADASDLHATMAPISASLERAGHHLQILSSGFRKNDFDFAGRFRSVEKLVNSTAANLLKAIDGRLDQEDSAATEDLRMQAEELSKCIASARRRAVSLGSDIAHFEAGNSSPSSLNADTLTRRQKMVALLDRLEEQLQLSDTHSFDVDRFQFAEDVQPIESPAGWSRAVEQTTESGIHPVSNPPPPSQETANRAATNLSAVLEDLAHSRENTNVRFALLLSDGRHNAAAESAPHDVATRLTGLPVYVVPIGSTIARRDAMLLRVEAPSKVAHNDSAVIDITVMGSRCKNLKTFVVLSQDGRVIDRKPIEFISDNSDCRVRFNVPAKKTGWQEFIVEVQPLPNEEITANNYQPVSFEVVQDRIRILFADRQSRWEYRYLNQLFRRDPHIECDELLFAPQLHGTGQLANAPAFPKDVESWARYDVVILGDIGPEQLSVDSQRSLDELVRKRGGDLIVMAGPSSMPASFASQPLLELLPVLPSEVLTSPTSFTVRVTDEGQFNSALSIAESTDDSRQKWESTFRRFPITNLSRYSRLKPSAHALLAAIPSTPYATEPAQQNDLAFLSWQRVGAGRVAYLAAPETFRLRWRVGDRLHHRFWGQFLRWFTAADSGSDLVRLQTDQSRYAVGEAVHVTMWLKDPSGRPLPNESLTADVNTFDGKATKVELTPDREVAGRYFASVTGLAPGAYQIGVSGPTISKLLPSEDDPSRPMVTIAVRESESMEMVNTQSDLPLLEQIAHATGGQVIPPTAIEEVFKFESANPRVKESTEREPIWNRWPNLVIVAGCLFAEWVTRRRAGLI